MSIKMIISFLIGMLVMCIISLSTVNTDINPEQKPVIKVKRIYKITKTMSEGIKILHYNYWLLGYRKGGEAAIEAINNRTKWNEQLKYDSFQVRIIIDSSEI